MIFRWLNRFDLFLNKRFFIGLGIVFISFIISYKWNDLFIYSKYLLTGYITLVFADLVWLILEKNPIESARIVQNNWSLGDENEIKINITSRSIFIWKVTIIDEPPFVSGFDLYTKKFVLYPSKNYQIIYYLVPNQRGTYHFRKQRVFLKSMIGLLSRRITFQHENEIKVLPSFIQMKAHSLKHNRKITLFTGNKNTINLGQSYEFEQIKNYVAGDDLRKINWKASGKTGSLMTNHFIDEKSQNIYCIIDKSKNMGVTHEGLTLFDFSINASLSILNASLEKGDKAGLFTFSDHLSTAIAAENQFQQLKRINYALFEETYDFKESDYEKLYLGISRIIKNRSLIFLFTNFEHIQVLRRNLNILNKINQKHYLIVIIFKDNEIEDFAFSRPNAEDSMVEKILARKYYFDKSIMAAELRKNGIQVMTPSPKQLTIQLINKYIELKSKDAI